jgi:hypothetical protein
MSTNFKAKQRHPHFRHQRHQLHWYGLLRLLQCRLL